MEKAIRADGARGTGSRAELAVKARVIVQGGVVFIHFGIDDHGIEQYETTEHGVNDVAVEAHLPKSGLNGYRFVRYHVHRAVAPQVSFHGKPGRRGRGTDAFTLQGSCQ